MRSAVAWIQATGWPSATRASAISSLPITIAQAPSDDGQVSSKRIGIPQHRGFHHLLQRDVGLMQVRQRVLRAVEPVLDRDHRADVRRRARAADVGADVRREVAARTGADRLGERHRNAQRPHGIGLGLLLPRHRQHAPVLAGLHQAGRHDRGRAADRAGGVHPDQRLAGRADRVGHEQLGHHHALEEVGRLADDDGVDVVERRHRSRPAPCRWPRAPGRSSRRPCAWRRTWSARCPEPRRVCSAIATFSPSMTATRFCCSAGPLVAWASTRCAEPSKMCRAAKPMRSRPAENIGLAASAPPDGLIFVDAVQADRLGEDQLLVAERRVELGDVDRAGVTAGRRLRRRRRRRRRGQVAGAQHRRLDAVLDTGDPRRALPQLAGPVAGGQHDRRRAVGDRRDVVAAQRICEVRPRQQLVDCCWPASRESTRGAAAANESSATCAICSAVHLPESSPNRACRPAIDTASGHSGATVYGSVCSARTRRRMPAEDLPKPYTSAVSTSPVSSLDVGLVQRPGGVHLDVRLVDRRHRADRVDRRDERECPPGKVIRGSRAPEADVGLLDAQLGVELGETRHQHLDAVGGAVGAAHMRCVREPDDGNVQSWLSLTGGACRCRSRRRARPSAGSTRCCRCPGPTPRGASTPPRRACPSAPRRRRSR